MRIKVTNSTEKITLFGGFNFVFRSFAESGLPDLIDKHLGARVKAFGFSYSDIFLNHLAVFFNGGDCTEDVNEHLREHLREVRACGYAVRIPSSGESRNWPPTHAILKTQAG